MNPIAKELNDVLSSGNGHLYEMLSEVGKNLFFPKGILAQSAEAKEKAHRFNATIGMATEKGRTMFLPSVMKFLTGLTPEEALTYAPSFGILPLRQAWREALYQKNPSLGQKEISLPIVTQAITHGLSVVGDMWVDPGDVLVLPDKIWGNYNLIFATRRGARIAQYPMFTSQRTFNLEGFAACVREHGAQKGKVLVMLNFPNNPTGYTVTAQEAEGIADILAATARTGTNVVAITDDAYFGLIYDDKAIRESVFTKLVGREDRLLAIKLDGATKENFVWGLRVGFISYGAAVQGPPRPIYEALEKKTAGAVRGSISNASHLSQQIVLRSMRSEASRAEREEKYRILRERAEEVRRVLLDPRYTEAFEAYPFNSGYFMCLRLKGVDAEALRVHLLDRYGVGLISIGPTDLRVAFSCLEKGDVRELFDTVLQGVQDLKN
jgi:aspartate/methionine/tyrosine aminotransferase